MAVILVFYLLFSNVLFEFVTLLHVYESVLESIYFYSFLTVFKEVHI